MPRPPKEYQSFRSLMRRLLTVPKEAVDRLQAEHKERAQQNPRKRGPKPKTV
jgi:hypothetical protein